MERVVVFGDVGGQYEAYMGGLAAAGVDVENLVVPAGLCVIQVGDLIHKGPQSNEVVAAADLLLSNSDGRYIQLFGNHEAQYVGGPGFWVDDTITDTTIRTLQRWWFDERSARAAVGVNHRGPMLVSHAGCTRTRWEQRYRSTRDVEELAALINEEAWDRPWAGMTSGFMLGGTPTSGVRPDVASVFWAEPGRELYPGWANLDEAPFGQVHGHASVVSWFNSGALRGHIPSGVPLTVDTDARTTLVTLGGKPFWGVDPGWGRTPRTKPQPYLEL